MKVLAIALQIFSIAGLAQSIQIKTQVEGIPSSIRGLSVIDNQVAWFSGSKGYIGRTTNGGKTWKYHQLEGYETKDFRSLYAFDSLNAIIASVASPAVVLKTSDGGKSWKSVYQNAHPDIFLDGIDFWDERSGMMYGDPINGKLFLLLTNDAGITWKEPPESQRPILNSGEASFAASGTGIRCVDISKAVIATGGLTSRLWISEDRGVHWKTSSPPIMQGKNSTGIFSISIHKKNWVVVGGDFEADSISTANAFYSLDAGKTWLSPDKNPNGYRSCINYVSGKIWIAAGQGGLDVSSDNGKTWNNQSSTKGIHVVRKSRKGNFILGAGQGKIVKMSLE